MKYILIASLLIIFSATTLADSIYVTPSLYYSRGDYTDERYSDSYAGYLTIGDLNSAAVLSFNRINIVDPLWKYNQNLFTIGGIMGFNRIYLKLNYGRVDAKENDLPYRYNIYSIDAFYTNYRLYLGGSYTHHMSGTSQLNIDNAIIRLEYIPHWRVLLSLKPMYTNVSDGRELFGTALRFHYLPLDYFLVKLHGFIGERAHFFDPDLLVLYNQMETQKNLAALQLEYFLSLNFNVIAGFQHTSFGSYRINYYILGLRSNFILSY
jgi:hypothetical protein